MLIVGIKLARILLKALHKRLPIQTHADDTFITLIALIPGKSA